METNGRRELKAGSGRRRLKAAGGNIWKEEVEAGQRKQTEGRS